MTRYCKLTVVLEVTKVSFFSLINIEHFGSKLVISLRFRDVKPFLIIYLDGISKALNVMAFFNVIFEIITNSKVSSYFFIKKMYVVCTWMIVQRHCNPTYRQNS